MPRRNVSFTKEIEARAQAIIKARGFQGRSDLLQALVREEYERRFPPQVKGVDEKSASQGHGPGGAGKKPNRAVGGTARAKAEAAAEDLRRQLKGKSESHLP